MPTPSDYITWISRDVDRIAELAGGGEQSLAAPVPACPGWSVRRVVEHLGAVHRMVTSAIVDRRPLGPGERPDATSLDGGELLTWFRDGADRMLDALQADPDTEAWAFDPEGGRVAFWQRRQAMEHAIHRIDVEQALDARTSIDPALADEGISEVIDVMMRLRQGEGALRLPPRGVTLTARDRDRSWVLSPGSPAAHAFATTEELFLALWKRVPVADLTGDEEALQVLALPLTP